MKIRKATKKDIPRIVELLNSEPDLTEDEGLSYNKRLIQAYLKEPSVFVFVYESNKKLTGVVIGCFWKYERHCYLFDLVVDKNQRNKGIGEELINYTENILKKNNAELIFFHSEENNEMMHKIVKRWGYKKGKKMYFFSKNLK